MFTRSMDAHQYTAPDYPQQTMNGFIRVVNVNNIPTTWAVSRPSSTPTPTYSPPPVILRGSGPNLSPAQPNVEMDPSNEDTWQRQYRFT